jgi:hypothetical protein
MLGGRAARSTIAPLPRRQQWMVSVASDAAWLNGPFSGFAGKTRFIRTGFGLVPVYTKYVWSSWNKDRLMGLDHMRDEIRKWFLDHQDGDFAILPHERLPLRNRVIA